MINGTQKNIIEGTLINGFGPLDEIRNKLKEKGISPQDAILALQAILLRGPLPADLQVKLQRWDLLGEVEEVRKILAHPAPQNRTTSAYKAYNINFRGKQVARDVTHSTDFVLFNGIDCHFDMQQEKVFKINRDGSRLELPGLKAEKITDRVFWKGSDQQFRSEAPGLLGLTARDDTPNAPRINKQDVVAAIHDVVQNEINTIKKDHSIQHVEPLVPAPAPQAELAAVEVQAQPEPVVEDQPEPVVEDQPEEPAPTPQPRPTRSVARNVVDVENTIDFTEYASHRFENTFESPAFVLAKFHSLFTALDQGMRQAVAMNSVPMIMFVSVHYAAAENVTRQLMFHQLRTAIEATLPAAFQILNNSRHSLTFFSHAEPQAGAQHQQRSGMSPPQAWAEPQPTLGHASDEEVNSRLGEMIQRLVR